MEIPICLAIFSDYLSHNCITEPIIKILSNINTLLKNIYNVVTLHISLVQHSFIKNIYSLYL